MKGLAFLLLAVGLQAARPPEWDKARDLYQRTEYHQSLDSLNKIGSKDAQVYQLIGQNWFMMGEYKKASDAFEKAAQLDPQNSQIFHWLGRSMGRRAETASFLTAPGYASKARQYFEKSVELDAK